MTNYPIPPDDIDDVIELQMKIENAIIEICTGHDASLAISALMTATVNCLITNSDDYDHLLFHRNVLLKLYDMALDRYRAKMKEKEL